MKRTNIYLEDRQKAALEKLATDRISFTEHVRRAIDEYLARHRVGARAEGPART